MHKLFPRSLRIRLLFASVAVELVMLALLVGNSVRLIQHHLVAQTEARIAGIELAYKTAVAVPLASRDYATLRDILDGWRSAPDILYLAVTDRDGRLLASSGWPTDRPLPQPSPNLSAFETAHITFPVKFLGQDYGNVHYGLDTDFLRHAQGELFTQSLMIALTEMALTFILLSITGFWLTRNLVRLTDASAQVAAGDYATRMPVGPEAADEVARLARHFNRMAEAVQGRIEELRHERERFRAIADYTYAWENWFDEACLPRWVNPAVTRITGYSEDECMHMPEFPLPLVVPEDRPLLRDQHRRACVGEVGQDLEFRIRRKDGQEVWVAMSWQPIFTEDGGSLGYRSSIRDITVQHDAVQELAYQATHDPLTGLHNRRAFEAHLSRLLGQTDPDADTIVVCYLDLDQFKVINDSCGHAAGDELLQRLAAVLRGRLHFGFLARLGGDEFGLVMTDCREEEALRRAARLIDEIRALPFSWDGRSYRLGASIGLARATSQLRTVEELLIAADTACFAAKERGRNRAELYAPREEYYRQRRADFTSLSQINHALEAGRLVLYYQRVQSLRAGVPDYAEVLVRMLDDEGGIIPPARFIPAAERYNMMPYIDRWVLDATLERLAGWLAQPRERPIAKVNINLSGLTLSDPELPRTIADALSRHRVSPSMVGFEITESSAISNVEAALRFIGAMRELGVSLALDDFGSGLSSFPYLKSFAVDLLKIDGLFVRVLEERNPTDRAVLESMTHLARAYGLRTVAEYVCSPAVLAAVQELGIDYAQGYAVHVPEPM